MGWQLHDTHGHSHGGGNAGHGHGHGENINVRAAFIHVLGDVLQSIGVFCAAIVIYFKPTWQLADPICTFIFSIIVLWTTITIMKDAILVSMYMFGSEIELDVSLLQDRILLKGFLVFSFISKIVRTMTQHNHTHTAIVSHIFIYTTYS